MRVLWICNIVVNDFTEEFGIQKRPFSGWLESLLHEMEGDAKIEVGFCFPIYDEERMRDGTCCGHHYYAFHGKPRSKDPIYHAKVRADFQRCFASFRPDVIHIWGAEHDYAQEAFAAAQALGLEDRVLLRLQAITIVNGERMLDGIPERYLTMKAPGMKTLLEQQEEFLASGRTEESLIRQIRYICDKSNFGKYYVEHLHPDACFTYCDNILREPFYKQAGTWSRRSCKTHQIFIAQAHWPLKGLHFLLLAVAVVRKRYPDVQLKVGGFDAYHRDDAKRSSGDSLGYTTYLHALMEKLHLGDCVEFLGMLDAVEMAHAYREAHVHVNASMEENKSNAICESMMIGTPTIASFVGGNVDAIHHGEDGLLFPIGNTRMLAGEICNIFGDDALAERLSRAATRAALARHDKQTIKEIHRKLYQKICDESQA